MAPFFAYYLKGKGSADLPEAMMFRTGSNQWVSHDAWPPKRNVVARQLYFQSDGKLSFEPPAANAQPQFDSYVSDPGKPGAVSSAPDLSYARDGRHGWSRISDSCITAPTCSTWVTEPLEEDVTVSGKIMANLFASTTGTDSDWIVKLIDVYPEKYEADPKMGGYQLMIAATFCAAATARALKSPSRSRQTTVTALSDRIPRQRSRFPEGTPDHGAGPEHLVPGDRSQPAAIRAEHLSRERVGLSASDPASISLGQACVTHRGAGSRTRTEALINPVH